MAIKNQPRLCGSFLRFRKAFLAGTCLRGFGPTLRQALEIQANERKARAKKSGTSAKSQRSLDVSGFTVDDIRRPAVEGGPMTVGDPGGAAFFSVGPRVFLAQKWAN